MCETLILVALLPLVVVGFIVLSYNVYRLFRISREHKEFVKRFKSG